MNSSTRSVGARDRSILVPLRAAFVAVPLLAGLDKFFGILADWSVYLAPAVRDLLPISPNAFFAVIGVVEIAVGVAMATRYVKIAAYVACAWLAAIAVQLILAGYIDVAVRDVVMAIAAWTLGRLSPAPAPRSVEERRTVEARA